MVRLVTALHVVQPVTVLAWHRRGFRLFWTWKSRRLTGRPSVPPDVPAQIRSMANAILYGVRTDPW